MSLRGNNFFHAVLAGVALVPQSVNNAAVNGVEIKEPWKKGRQISFLFLGGAFGASVTATCKVQGLKRSDGTTWEALKESDGSTDLAFTASKLSDTAQAENGSILGTLDMSRIDGDTYKSIRVVYDNDVAQAALVAIGYIISDLYTHPSGTADDLFSKQTGQ